MTAALKIYVTFLGLFPMSTVNGVHLQDSTETPAELVSAAVIFGKKLILMSQLAIVFRMLISKVT